MKRCKNITCWTDYPVLELGDISGEKTTIRRVKVLSYDNDKYARVTILGTNVELEIKAGYLYRKAIYYPKYNPKTPKRYDTGLFISRRKLERMI